MVLRIVEGPAPTPPVSPRPPRAAAGPRPQQNKQQHGRYPANPPASFVSPLKAGRRVVQQQQQPQKQQQQQQQQLQRKPHQQRQSVQQPPHEASRRRGPGTKRPRPATMSGVSTVMKHAFQDLPTTMPTTDLTVATRTAHPSLTYGHIPMVASETASVMKQRERQMVQEDERLWQERVLVANGAVPIPVNSNSTSAPQNASGVGRRVNGPKAAFASQASESLSLDPDADKGEANAKHCSWVQHETIAGVAGVDRVDTSASVLVSSTGTGVNISHNANSCNTAGPPSGGETEDQWDTGRDTFRADITPAFEWAPSPFLCRHVGAVTDAQFVHGVRVQQATMRKRSWVDRELKAIQESHANLTQEKCQEEAHSAWNNSVLQWCRLRDLGLRAAQMAECLKMLRVFFDALDADGSGEISGDELFDPLSAIGVVRDRNDMELLLLQYDTSGNGEIDFQEFTQMLLYSHDGRTAAMLKFFQAYNEGVLGDRCLPFPLLVQTYGRQQVVSAVLNRAQVNQRQKRVYNSRARSYAANHQVAADSFLLRETEDRPGPPGRGSRRGAGVGSGGDAATSSRAGSTLISFAQASKAARMLQKNAKDRVERKAPTNGAPALSRAASMDTPVRSRREVAGNVLSTLVRLEPRSSTKGNRKGSGKSQSAMAETATAAVAADKFRRKLLRKHSADSPASPPSTPSAKAKAVAAIASTTNTLNLSTKLVLPAQPPQPRRESATAAPTDAARESSKGRPKRPLRIRRSVSMDASAEDLSSPAGILANAVKAARKRDHHMWARTKVLDGTLMSNDFDHDATENSPAAAAHPLSRSPSPTEIQQEQPFQNSQPRIH